MMGMMEWEDEKAGKKTRGPSDIMLFGIDLYRLG